MKTFVFSAHPYEIPYLETAAAGKHELVFDAAKLTYETASLAAGCEAIALFTADDASEKVLQKLAALGIKYIALRSAGFDHVNLTKAEQLGIAVANVPAYSPYSIAEHAVAMLLALNRRIVESQMLMRMHDFRLDSLVGFDLHGKTVGVIGTGVIGTKFAKVMNGFGTRLLGCDPVENKEALEIGVQYVPLEKLLAESDIVSIHCPLNPSTRYLISEKQIAVMKKGAYLINTSRGGVVDTKALVEGIERGHLGGACLDVYENEKKIFFEDHRDQPIQDPLLSRILNNRNILVTGHQAFLTKQALTGIAQTTIDNLDFWEDQQVSPNQLNLKISTIQCIS